MHWKQNILLYIREGRKRTHQAYKLVDSQAESKPHLATLKTAVL